MKTMLIRYVPEDVHKAFQEHCKEKKISMNKMLIILMAKETGKFKGFIVDREIIGFDQKEESG